MAVIQGVWTFNPTQFHQLIEENIIVNSNVHLDLLRVFAKTAVVNQSQDTARALEFLRFDEEWVDSTKQNPSLWYLLALTSTLIRAPSLSDHYAWGWSFAEKVLGLADWSNIEIQHLIQGKSLQTLLLSSGNALFTSSFDFQTGYSNIGWLSLENAQSLLVRLQSSKHFFLSPSQQMIETIGRPTDSREERIKALRDTYSDALEMLQTAIKRKNALFMIID